MTKQFQRRNKINLYHLGASLLFGAMLCSSALLNLGAQATAQTDFNILSESKNLKSEFQKELDKWMLRAYEGDRDAQFKVGVLFANDQFGPPDNEQAAYWYKQAARQGHVLAQYNLGHQYLTGAGVKRDEKQAMQWWLKAAQQQHALAQFNVGRAYYLGIGLQKDLPQAKLWFERASQNNEPKSTELLKQLGWWNPNSIAAVEQPIPQTQTIAEIESTPSDTPELVSKVEPISDVPIIKHNSSEPGRITTDTPSTDDVEPTNLMEGVSETTPLHQANESTLTKQPIALFTNPAIRSVLITIIDHANSLNVIEQGKLWTKVSTDQSFPVWVHQNFINVAANQGTISATSVNARSVPLITTGSVIGRFNRGEQVTVFDKRNDWYRVSSPTRFFGWVKTDELIAANNAISAKAVDQSTDTQPSKSVPQSEAATANDAITPISSQPKEKQFKEKTSAQGSENFTVTPHEKSLTLLPPSVNDNAWLFSQDENAYTLQLASFNDVESIKRYIDNLPFKQSKELHLFTTKSNDIEWTYVIYGSYEDKETAKNTSVTLKQQRAWIRRLGVLQQNRCIAWKKQLPAPKELNKFCK